MSNLDRIELQTRKELDTILAAIPAADRSEQAHGFRAIHAAMTTGSVPVLKANELWNRFCVGNARIRAEILTSLQRA